MLLLLSQPFAVSTNPMVQKHALLMHRWGTVGSRSTVAVVEAAMISLEDEVSVQWIVVAGPHSVDDLEGAAAAAGAVAGLL
jgi:hypothetical protein